VGHARVRAEYADDIADIVAKYAKYNGRRKPEQLEPNTYSLVNYNEAARIVDEYKALAARAEKISAALPAASAMPSTSWCCIR
jgi:hypothetical protein